VTKKFPFSNSCCIIKYKYYLPMSKKNLITCVNILSLAPILIYPVVFISGIMFFDSPRSNQQFTTWVYFSLSLLYPFLIGLFVFLSKKYTSLSLSLIALIPFLFFSYELYKTNGFVKYRSDFETRIKDFECNENSFLSFEPTLGSGETGHLFKGITKFSNPGIFSYTKDSHVAEIIDNSWIMLTYEKDSDILLCKDKDGKTLSEIYKKIDEKQYRDILFPTKENSLLI